MVFEAIATCLEGLEEITQLEIKEILKAKSEVIIPSRVKFKVRNENELTNFICNTRSSIKVYKLIDKIEFSTLEDLIIKAKKIKFPNIKGPFAVKCDRSGEHNFNSIDIEKEFGNITNKEGKLKVDLKNPTTIVIVDIINDHCLIGVDYTGIKLSKRDYRIKLIPNSLNPCLAYSMIRISEVNDKEKILDPFCRSGEIIIEAVLFLKNIPPNKKSLDNLAFTKLINFKPKIKTKEKKLKLYAVDNLQNSLRSAEINAKIVGINKEINFSRNDIEWLDTKFDKSSIDKIITFPPFPTNINPKEKIEKLYKELFYQTEFILNAKGTITILTPCPELIEKHAASQKFKKIREYKINYIHQSFYVVVFKR